MKNIYKIKVIPDSPKTRLLDKRSRADIDLVVELTAPAENGKANKELIKFLRNYLGKEVQIVSGFKTRIKVVEAL